MAVPAALTAIGATAGKVAAGAGALTGLGAMGLWQQDKLIKAEKEAAQVQMDFQERMRNTAYQAAVQDLKEAGLNPILATGGQAPMAGGAMRSTEGEGQLINMLANSAMTIGLMNIMGKKAPKRMGRIGF